MPDYFKKISLCLLAILALTAIFFSFVQASFWDTIRAWVVINPLEVDVLTPLEAEVEKVFKVEARAINKGEKKIEEVKGEIFFPPGLVLIQKSPVKEIGVIPGKKEKKVSWSIKGEEIGNYIILVKVFGELEGEVVSAERSAKVEIKESMTGPRPQRWLENFFDFFQSRFKF